MLRAESASYRYDEGTSFEVSALHDVTVDVAPGRLMLVAGETGSGKTTFLRLLAGLAEPSGGAVTIDGKKPEPASADPERRVGLLFQRAESQLFADTVEADVMFGPRNLGVETDEARVLARSALASVGLGPEEYAERSPFTLSGGEARRAALAGVLAMEPRYLLLDEPTAGLDATGRAAVRDAVANARDRCGVVVVTHDVEELLDIADDMVVLDDGRARFAGGVDEFVVAVSRADTDLPIPATIRVQLALREAGLALGRVETDPVRAARMIIEAGGRG